MQKLRGLSRLRALSQELQCGESGFGAVEGVGIAGKGAVPVDQKAIGFAGLAPGYEKQRMLVARDLKHEVPRGSLRGNASISDLFY
jgi:hypothetical protein